MILRSLCLFATISISVASESEDMANELAAAYDRLPGFIATYTSRFGERSMELTIARDSSSGLGVFHFLAETPEGPKDIRQWNNEQDRYFVTGEGVKRRIDGLGREAAALARLGDDLGGIITVGKWPRPPMFALLTPDQLRMGSGDELPAWLAILKSGKLDRADARTATFTIENFGSLTITRATGLLDTQSITRANGQEGLLKAENVVLDPGKKAVLEVTAGWEEEVAVAASETFPAVALNAQARSRFFQDHVTAVDQGQVTLEQLNRRLGDHQDSLRAYAAVCLYNLPGTIPTMIQWAATVDEAKEEYRKKWQQLNTKGGETFEAYLKTPTVREETRLKYAAAFHAVEANRAKAMAEIIPGKPLPTGTTEAGKEAARRISDALSLAYFQAIMDRTMEEAWGEPAGPR